MKNKLVPCPVCGRLLSPSAPFCRKGCGSTEIRTQRNIKIFKKIAKRFLIFVAIVIILIIVI
jgi:predicted nucleic acid-binding Zn ribbon protein